MRSGKVRAIIYTQPTCGPCKAVKQYLADKGVEYDEKDVTKDPEALDELLAMGYRGTPVVKVGDKSTQGFNVDDIDNLIGE
jgi:glutaredoxin 3